MSSFIGFLIFLLLLCLVLWIGHLRRQIAQLRALSRQAQKEQEAVLSLIDKLGEKITSKIDLDETLQIITEYIVEATKGESGAIFVVNENDQTMQARVVVGPFPPLHETQEFVYSRASYPVERIKKDRIHIGEGLIGLVAQEGEPLLITDAEADPRVPRHLSQAVPIHSIILCPLHVRGRVLGVIAVVNKRGAAIFDSRDMALLQALADQAAVTVDLVKLYDVLAEQQRLEQELSIAHGFQKMLLPTEFPSIPGFEIYGTSEAALVVGGDFFDFFEVDRTHLGLVIADVAGKGIPGALIMAMVRSVLRAESRGQLSPKQVLRRVNDRLLADTKENIFITMTYSILDIDSHRLRFVRAGHEPTMVRDAQDHRVALVSPEGIALGLVGGELFERCEEAEIQLRAGEVVLLYTDGVIEAMDQTSQEYGRERLITRIQKREDATAADLVTSIVEDIHQFTLGIPQHDDLTLLALRVTAPGVEEQADAVENPSTHNVQALGR